MPQTDVYHCTGVGIVGAEGAAAPRIFSQWVQTMYYASPIIGDKSPFIVMCINTEVCSLTKYFVTARFSRSKVAGKETI